MTTVSAKLNWMAYSELPWRPFPGHQAWSWTTLRRGNVFYYVNYKRFFSILSRFYVFNVFKIFIWTFCLHLWLLGLNGLASSRTVTKCDSVVTQLSHLHYELAYMLRLQFYTWQAYFGIWHRSVNSNSCAESLAMWLQAFWTFIARLLSFSARGCASRKRRHNKSTFSANPSHHIGQRLRFIAIATRDTRRPDSNGCPEATMQSAMDRLPYKPIMWTVVTKRKGCSRSQAVTLSDNDS